MARPERRTDPREDPRVRRWTRPLAVLSAAVTTIVTLAGPAQASPPQITDHGKYCTYYVPTGRMSCAANEADLASATAAAMGLPLAALQQKQLTATPLAIFYDNVNYDTSGGYLTFLGSAPCTSSKLDLDASWSDTTTWRTRISSFRGQSGCWVKVWFGANFTGPSLPYAPQNPNLGSVLNDHVFSAQFT